VRMVRRVNGVWKYFEWYLNRCVWICAHFKVFIKWSWSDDCKNCM
jgi:hypothetical protein